MMDKDTKAASLLKELRSQTAQIIDKETPLEFGSENFIAMLAEKMDARNVDPRAISYVSDNPKYIYSSYDHHDPEQIEILNNKVEQAYLLFVEVEDRDAALSPGQKKALNLLFGSKH